MGRPTVTITKRELLDQLHRLVPESLGDPEAAHVEADKLLVEYINDPQVSRIFDDIDKWYA